jgi:hypothetical protein
MKEQELFAFKIHYLCNYTNLKAMLTINVLLKELKNIPLDKLDEVYRYLRSIDRKPLKSARLKGKIMSYAGIFSDMTEDDYSGFLSETKRIRENLFDRSKAQ